MDSFKEYLNEEVVYGDTKGSKVGIYYLAPLNSFYANKKDVIAFLPKDLPKDAIAAKLTPSGMVKFFNYLMNIKDDIKRDRNKYTNDTKKKIENDSSLIKTWFKIEAPSYIDKRIIKFVEDDLLRNIKSNISSKIFYSKILEKIVSGNLKVSDMVELNMNYDVHSYRKYQINTTTKSIMLKEDYIGSASRIGKIGNNSQATYLIPFTNADFNAKEILKTFKSLIKYNPDFANYRFIDIEYKESFILKDIINGTGRILNSAKALDNIMSKSTGKIIAYHGTSMKDYNDYIKSDGLRPGKGMDYNDKIKNHSEYNLYFTFELGDARKYATRASGASKAVVLACEINDFSKIVFDEDNLQGSINRMKPSVMKWLKERIYKAWKDDRTKWIFAQADNYLELPGHSIDDMYIESWRVSKAIESGNLTPEQTKIIKFITANAINNIAAYTFGYRGSIPSSKIKVLETFKPMKHNDNYKEDDNKRRFIKTVKSMKTHK